MDDIGVNGKTGFDVYGYIGLVGYQSHGVWLLWIQFVAISPTESQIAYGTKTPKHQSSDNP
jgi:hypothetical protein